MTSPNPNMREQALCAYFGIAPEKPRFGPALAIFGSGLLLFLSGVSLSDPAGSYTDPTGCSGCAGVTLTIPGLLLTATGVVIVAARWFSYRNRFHPSALQTTDGDVQSTLEAAFAQASERALSASGLARQELVARPLVICGPVLWRTDGVPSSDLVWKCGRDGAARFGVYTISAILLSRMHLVVYSCLFNLIRCAFLNERTDELQYRNVISVSTADYQTSHPLPGGQVLTSTHEFRISIASGETIRVVVDSHQMRKMLGIDALPDSGAERAVRAIRAMLREAT